MSLTPIATTVSPDEKAFALVEVVLTPYSFTKGGRKFRPKSWSGKHRYQILYVNRGDRIAEYHRDLGDAALFESGPFRIPSLWEHTVGELQEIADNVRSRVKEDRSVMAELQGRSTLVRDAAAFFEEVYKRRRGQQSVFGPAIKVQR